MIGSKNAKRILQALTSRKTALELGKECGMLTGTLYRSIEYLLKGGYIGVDKSGERPLYFRTYKGKLAAEGKHIDDPPDLR